MLINTATDDCFMYSGFYLFYFYYYVHCKCVCVKHRKKKCNIQNIQKPRREKRTSFKRLPYLFKGLNFSNSEGK